jgi:hypothetical protein
MAYMIIVLNFILDEEKHDDDGKYSDYNQEYVEN